MVSGTCSIVRLAMAAGAALLFGICVAPLGAFAEPLDKDACGKLQTEKAALTTLGVDKEFAKGPDWAKANLTQAQLNQLKRFLTIDEQLKFRCGLAMVTLQVPDDVEDGDDDSAEPASAGSVPMPGRRDQAATTVIAKPAKPAAAPVQTQPAAVKPAPPAKPAPKPVDAKAQSSLNAETAPMGWATPRAPGKSDPEPRRQKPPGNDGPG